MEPGCRRRPARRGVPPVPLKESGGWQLARGRSIRILEDDTGGTAGASPGVRLVLWMLLLAPWPAAAIDESYRDLLRGIASGMRHTRTELPTWFYVGAVVVLVAAVAIARHDAQRRLPRTVRRARAGGHRRRSFAEHAAAMGRRRMEMRNLYRIASRLSPGSPDLLLTSADGHQYLAQGLARQARWRHKEVALLERLIDRLGVAGQVALHDRAGVRIAAPLGDLRRAIAQLRRREQDELAPGDELPIQEGSP